MERLTYRDAKGEAWYSDKGTEADRLHFIADIEDIMGDECNLSRLIELVTAYKEGRYIIMRYAEQKGVARLLELSEADRDGRCVVLPAEGYTEKDGENALKSAMNTCFYHNNPVTRYIADAVAEKLTREDAEDALKGNGGE